MGIERIATCLQELGYRSLTEIQKKALLEALREDKSIMIVAPTGSGKTEAAVFPVMLKIKTRKINPIAAIYITPLRALNRDIERRLNNIAACFEINVGVRHGDTPLSIRKNIVQSPPHILITTPESFNYIIINEDIRPHLRNLEFIIIDEFRDLVESKRGLLFFTTLFFLEKAIGKRFFKIALTATIHDDTVARRILSLDEHDNIELIRDPSLRKMEITVNVPVCRSELCRELNNIVQNEDLAARIEEILNRIIQHKYVLVFTNTRSLAESLGALLREIVEKLGQDISLDVHHGSLSRQHREKIEREFRERKISSIIATSSLELGIDIGHVEYVIQYASPRQVTRLVQRVGRSRHRLGEISRGEVISTSNLIHILEACVIALNTINGQLEKEVIIYKPLDVLAYSIALYVYLNPSGVKIDTLYNEIKQHPLFRDLEESELREVIDYLVYTRVIKSISETLYPTKKTRLYLYRISMIPSTREVMVIEASSNKRIGSLDEEYVVVNLNPGDVIVLAGRAWRIISYNEIERKLYVEPAIIAKEVVIPHWEGENIPVEYRIAREVGEVVDYLKTHGDLPHIVRNILSTSIESPGYDTIKELGDHKSIYIDYIKEYNLLIINVYGGSKVNALIRDLLKNIIRSRYPYLKVTTHSTPYYVVIQVGDARVLDYGFSLVEQVYEIIRNLERYAKKDVIEKTARDSTQYLWRIYQVAQRFGAISPETTYVNRRLLEAFTETVIGREALKEVLIRDYDIDSFNDLASRISSGEIEVALRRYERLQDHHLILLGYIETPLLKELPLIDRNSFLEKLLNRQVTLLCLRCSHTIRDKVREIIKMKSFNCPKCGLATLTLIKGDISREKELVSKLKRGEKIKGEESSLHMDLAERAVLLYRFGDKAVLALSTLGVGTRDAARIINRYMNGEDLLELLYEYEKRFLKVKKYLDGKDK